MTPVLGIDLGTTNSAMAVVNRFGRPEILVNREGGRVTPSVVLLDDDGPVVGEIARQSALMRPQDTVEFVKRHMGERDWQHRTPSGAAHRAEEISAMILRRLRDDAQEQLDEPVKDAVISVPAYFDDAARKATVDAATIVGLEVLAILNEPTAAALAHGTGSGYQGTMLVYDLGGGTFDVTIMRISGSEFTVLGTDGDRQLGGYDWDNELIKWLNEQFRADGGPDLLQEPQTEQMLRDHAVRAKHTISARESANVFLAVHGFSSKMTLDRTTFNDLTAPLLNRTGRLVDKAMEDAGVQWTDIDDILLVGGSTRMTQVGELISTVAGRRASVETNPDEVVALGAAIHGAVLQSGSGQTLAVPLVNAGGERIETPRVHDVTAHSLGLVIVDDDSGQLVNAIMIRRGARLPTNETKVFVTMSDFQAAWECEVTEGEDWDLRYVNVVGGGEIALPGRYPAGAPMAITLGYDLDALIHVSVQDLVSGHAVGELHLDRAANLAPEVIDRHRRAMDEIEVS